MNILNYWLKLCPLMASAGLVNAALQAGIPALKILSRKQNIITATNICQLISIDREGRIAVCSMLSQNQSPY